MTITGLDHIVLGVADVEASRRFYAGLLGLEAREERPGKYSLHFGDHKISLHDAARLPDIARNTRPGSGNFCLLCDEPVDELARKLEAEGVTIVAGPDRRDGATGPLQSIYFNDPDGNLVEVSNRLEAA